jgi:ethanolamine utilization cobalamin adenosyltransferase
MAAAQRWSSWVQLVASLGAITESQARQLLSEKRLRIKHMEVTMMHLVVLNVVDTKQQQHLVQTPSQHCNACRRTQTGQNT